MDIRRVLKTKIGELLIKRNLLTAQQLEAALKAQKENGGYISQHLISLGFVSEKNIAECLTSQYSFAYLPLTNYEISEEMLKIIPFKFVNTFSLLPIDKIGNILSVVMADPLNEGVIDMLKQITGYDIQVLISTYTEIRNAINKYFGEEIENLSQGKPKEDELYKNEILKSFIQVKGFEEGKERRKYPRKEVNLNMVYFFQDKKCKAKVKNISYGGLLFIAEKPLPVEKEIYTHIICKIFAKKAVLSSIVQIVRMEKIQEPLPSDSKEKRLQKYNIAGFFDFMTEEDRSKLRDILLN